MRSTLHVAQLVTTLARGGAQATVLASADMADHGVEVTVLAGPDDPGEGTHWGDSDPTLDHTVVVPSLHRSIHPVEDARTLQWLVSWLARNRPDVVHTHSAKAGLLGRIAARRVGIPAVHTVHGWGQAADASGSHLHPSRLSLFTMERILASWCEALVVVTPLDADTGLDHGIGRAEQYRVIRSGVDLVAPRHSVARRSDIRTDLGVDDRFVVGTVARLARQKDLHTLIAGFDQAGLEEAVLIVIGDGPLGPELRAEVLRRGLAERVRFLGPMPEAAKLVAAFDVFVLSSRWEGLPRSVIEAMAARVPVVATPVGGVAEIVRHGETGLVIPVGRPRELARAIRQVATDPGGARTRAQAATTALEPFGVEHMRDQLAALWFEVAQNPGDQGAGSLRRGSRRVRPRTIDELAPRT